MEFGPKEGIKRCFRGCYRYLIVVDDSKQEVEDRSKSCK